LRARSATALIAAVLTATVLTVLTATALTAQAGAQTVIQPATPWVSVGTADPVAPIASGYVGLSMEYDSAADVAGPAGNPDTVFEQLVRNLTPGQAPVLRIGGDSTDHTWWPAAGLATSPGLEFALTPAWMASMSQLAGDLGAEMIMGVNLEDDSPQLASTEATALLQGIGASHIEAFEVGNEPSLYATLPWYLTPTGVPVAGRPPTYDYSDYAAQFKNVVASLGSTPLAGPALGAPPWMRRLPTILDDNPELQIVTYHRYPLDRCYTSPSSDQYPTIANLLSTTATDGLGRSILKFAAIAHADGRQFRVDELNSVACSGEPGVSDTFASALWVLDTLFAFARNGANGVNIHTFPSAAYRLFNFTDTAGAWSGTVAPEYYGLLMFAQAAPPGAQLLRVVSHGDSALAAWATKTAPDTTDVTLINKSATTPAVVTVRAPVDTGPATVELLTAPSLTATNGVTIGATSFGATTTTGELEAAPQTTTVTPTGGTTYSVTVPAASAALVTVPGSAP
jgi:hypothetical protein